MPFTADLGWPCFAPWLGHARCTGWKLVPSVTLAAVVNMTANDPTIYPTHSCFDDAMEFIEHEVGTDALSNPTVEHGFRIVHAVMRMPSGRRYAHAWCEDIPNRFVWQRGIIDGVSTWYAYRLADWFAVMQVDLHTRYTLRTWCELNAQTGHYGPWRREYLELARDGDARTLGTERREADPRLLVVAALPV